MTRLLSFALVSCLLTGSVRADIGCAICCPTEACDDCACQARGKRGCGLFAHGGWLKRKASCGECAGDCFSGCDTGDCGPACGDACECGGGFLKRRGHGHGCGRGGLLGHRHHHCIDGLDRHFNCGCNGSYNYPVPPSYTYHWPGMYKAQRMTDYRSPWRFPPLRPYTEETLRPLIEETPVPGTMTMSPGAELRPQSAGYQAEEAARGAGEVESVSNRLQLLSPR